MVSSFGSTSIRSAGCRFTKKILEKNLISQKIIIKQIPAPPGNVGFEEVVVVVVEVVVVVVVVVA